MECHLIGWLWGPTHPKLEHPLRLANGLSLAPSMRILSRGAYSVPLATRQHGIVGPKAELNQSTEPAPENRPFKRNKLPQIRVVAEHQCRHAVKQD
ncbi:Zinc finger and BTB domain-containing protein 2 [Anopheles sinensis]|uniref:Zinc finger and BTB domain-containing protein 2 n=1 Tax=Anopheles sinensis TaxID=74873 RepID=A0A084VZK5_ANOSI|nr:Zinc finger and BTB domain-containing protein 2 [Anopheles sinensis]